MSAGMDVRLSADSEIKRLQEMVKRLENRNAQLKTSEVSRRPAAKDMDQVKVQLGLDDVPLLDLNEGKLDEEDSWLFESPVHAPSPAQKSVSPYKYLQHSVDTSELNRIRGSLMAKLESISSQEVALRLHTDNVSPRQTDEKNNKDNEKERYEAVPFREPSFEELEEELEELQQLTVRLDYNSPVKRRGAKQIVPQTTMYQDNPGTFTRRRGAPIGAGRMPDEEDDLMAEEQRNRGTFVRRRGQPANHFPDNDDDLEIEEEKNRTFVRRRGQPANHSVINVPDNDDDLDVDSAPVRRRGSKPGTPQPRGSLDPPQTAWADENDDEVSPVQPRRRGHAVEQMDCDEREEERNRTFVRRRGQPANHSAINVPDNDDDLDVDSAPVRRRGSKPGTPQPRGSLGPHQAARADGEEVSPVQPRRRGEVEQTDLGEHGLVVRRRPSPRNSTARQPVKPEANNFDEDNDTATLSAQTIPVVSAVRRRQSAADGGTQLRRSMSPQQYGTTPNRRGNTSRLLKPDDTEVRRRSLPQVPSHVSPVSKSEHFGLRPPGSRTPPRRRGAQNEPGPVPRGSKLAAPRRAVTPRGASPQPDDDSSWRDGCF